MEEECKPIRNQGWNPPYIMIESHGKTDGYYPDPLESEREPKKKDGSMGVELSIWDKDYVPRGHNLDEDEMIPLGPLKPSKGRDSLLEDIVKLEEDNALGGEDSINQIGLGPIRQPARYS